MTTLSKEQFLKGLKDPQLVAEYLRKNCVYKKILEFYSQIKNNVWKYHMEYNNKTKIYKIELCYDVFANDEEIVKIIRNIFPPHAYYMLNIGYHSTADHTRTFLINLSFS